MVKHVICFKLADNSKEKCLETRDVLLKMKGNVPTVIDVEVNIDQLHSSRSYDIILEVWVKDWDALAAYQIDEYHCKVVKTHMSKVSEKSVAMDYEV